GEGRVGRAIGAAILLLIFFNVIAVIIETVESYQTAWAWQFVRFEQISVAVFSAEYALRLWSCTATPAYHGAIRGRLRYIVSPMALVDLAAILPFYLPLFITGMDLRT